MRVEAGCRARRSARDRRVGGVRAPRVPHPARVRRAAPRGRGRRARGFRLVGHLHPAAPGLGRHRSGVRLLRAQWTGAGAAGGGARLAAARGLLPPPAAAALPAGVGGGRADGRLGGGVPSAVGSRGQLVGHALRRRPGRLGCVRRRGTAVLSGLDQPRAVVVAMGGPVLPRVAAGVAARAGAAAVVARQGAARAGRAGRRRGYRQRGAVVSVGVRARVPDGAGAPPAGPVGGASRRSAAPRWPAWHC